MLTVPPLSSPARLTEGFGVGEGDPGNGPSLNDRAIGLGGSGDPHMFAVEACDFCHW